MVECKVSVDPTVVVQKASVIFSRQGRSLNSSEHQQIGDRSALVVKMQFEDVQFHS